ncbi:glycosyltransferase family 2 protein [Paenibacillus sp. S150]|uniref:glycosyltransferase family 2 protein n=1 Tax=Paenibacillus sp. S150 TaxID=2749826 RepID=UPI001C597702|nr:glycosyltransferase family 2 protein [Paenibacillus sp. S150]MBW4081070.1 glycosyltransferase family 2 protein [Paenibacillus sp. S150]
MNHGTRVSVVIPLYNCPYVHLAIESVLTQSYRDIEIIVVNDGSTLHTEKLAPYTGRIKVLNKVNGGTASALNLGIKYASGAYFAWLSADDQFHPDKIRRQMETLRGTQTSFNHTAYYYINELGQRFSDIVRMSPHSKTQLIEIMMKGCPVNGSSVLLDMNIFKKVGLFNEKLLYTQDYDLWLRILPHYEWSYIEDPLLDYRVHKEMGSVIHSEAQNREIKQVQEQHQGTLVRLLGKEGER